MSQLPLPILDTLVILMWLINLPNLLKRKKATKEWTKVKGTIMEFRMGMKISHWKYSYEFSGKICEGSDANQGQGLLAELKVGSEVPLLVNPSNPSESYIDPPIGYFYKILFLFSFALFVITILKYSL